MINFYGKLTGYFFLENHFFWKTALTTKGLNIIWAGSKPASPSPFHFPPNQTFPPSLWKVSSHKNTKGCSIFIPQKAGQKPNFWKFLKKNCCQYKCLNSFVGQPRAWSEREIVRETAVFSPKDIKARFHVSFKFRPSPNLVNSLQARCLRCEVWDSDIFVFVRVSCVSCHRFLSADTINAWLCWFVRHTVFRFMAADLLNAEHLYYWMVLISMWKRCLMSCWHQRDNEKMLFWWASSKSRSISDLQERSACLLCNQPKLYIYPRLNL